MPETAQLRERLAAEPLDPATVAPDPVEQFRRWFSDAERAGLIEPNAMTLATVDATGQPSARVVLLKGFDSRGFVFFTDYRSRKSRELDSAPKAALCFLWKEIQRQVRITGSVERVSHEESAAYFATRPRGSQLGAWTSHQSEVLPSRDMLDRKLRETTARFANADVPLPPHWGGFRVIAVEIEFWQGRESRLHDRVLYRRSAGSWERSRLSP